MADKKVMVFIIPVDEDPNLNEARRQAVAECEEIMGHLGIRGALAHCTEDPAVVAAVEQAVSNY